MIQDRYIWKNGSFLREENATINVMTHGLHYGTGVFEGIRAYKTNQGTAILKLKEHVKRFLYSMRCLNMYCNYSEVFLNQAIIDTVKKNRLDSCYIRPLSFFGKMNGVGIIPQKKHPIDTIIACSPMGRYTQSEMADVMVSKYIRIHPKSTICDAKISGHYVNSFLACMENQNTKYHETLLLDMEGNIAECAVQNIFFIKNGRVITTPLGTILNGITRNLVFEILKYLNVPIEEKYFKIPEIIRADEAFLTGTAAEITPVSSINDHNIGKKSMIGKITKRVIETFRNITIGEKDFKALTYI